MKILLSGVETNNKGAELMLYAILQEIERKWPEAEVFLSKSRVQQGLDYVNTKLDFKCFPFEEIEMKLHMSSIYDRLNIPCRLLPHIMAMGNVDYYIDGSGFRFSDQFNFSHREINVFHHILKTVSKTSKIIFLPQAFGPFKKKETKEILSVINQYADLLIPRERVSYDYLKESGLVDMQKVKIFSDFTSLVDGSFPSKYEHLKDGICIVPNMKMIEKGGLSYDNYINIISTIISEGKRSKRPVYLLNHEGAKDEAFCYKCKESISAGIEIVTGLNALHVKGLISSAYLVLTSRFHGLASALNSCVPCLSTSWSHKYEELYRDYGLEGYVLPLNNKEEIVSRVRELLIKENNAHLRKHLSIQIPRIKEDTRRMWKNIWSL